MGEMIVIQRIITIFGSCAYNFLGFQYLRGLWIVWFAWVGCWGLLILGKFGTVETFSDFFWEGWWQIAMC